MVEKTILKYLFTVVYDDGTEYIQSQDDVSISDPLRSAFYDIDIDKVVTFTLNGNAHTYMVDLRSGQFEIDGALFIVGEQLSLDNPSRKLIYYRQHTHEYTLGLQEIAHEVLFCMGWEIVGTNIKRVIYIP